MYHEAQVQEKARQIARIISDERLEELALDKVEGVPTYDGTFKTIYNMVKENQIKLLTRYGQVVGMSVNSGTGSVELDNVAAERFNHAYDAYTAYNYLQTAMALKKARAQVDDIVEESGKVKIYLYGEGKILDEQCNIVVALNDEQVREATMENVRQLLDDAYEAKYASKHEHTAPRECDSDNLVIPADEAHNVDISSTSAIKRYLRNKYQRFLQGGCVPQAVRNDDGSITVSDIAWGRTMSRDEKLNH